MHRPCLALTRLQTNCRYVIIQGKVRAEGGKRNEDLNDGELFGNESLLESTAPAVANYTSQGGVVCVIVDRKILRELVEFRDEPLPGDALQAPPELNECVCNPQTLAVRLAHSAQEASHEPMLDARAQTEDDDDTRHRRVWPCQACSIQSKHSKVRAAAMLVAR